MARSQPLLSRQGQTLQLITKKVNYGHKKFYCYETSSLDLTLLEAEKKKGKS
jgi:hypothetical protein